MRPYIGKQMIHAEPMSRGEYLAFRNWTLPAGEDPLDSGFLIENRKIRTESGGPYRTWMVEAVFKAMYEPFDHVDFSHALRAVKAGHRVAREGWNGKGMFIFLVPGSKFKVNRPPLLGIYPEGTEISYHAHVDMKTANGDVVPWLASQTDLLANDWCVVEDKSNEEEKCKS